MFFDATFQQSPVGRCRDIATRVIKADVAFKSLEIKFVTTYMYTQLILSLKKTMHGLVIKLVMQTT